MNIAFVLNITVILLGLLFILKDRNKKHRKAYIIICFGLLVFFNAYKSLSVGSDTETYYMGFVRAANISWEKAWRVFFQRYFGIGGDYDEGFTLYLKFLQFFSHDFIFMMFFSSLFYCIPLGIIFYRYTTDYRQLIFAFVLFITLLYNGGSMFSRQQVATCFLLISFLNMMKDKYYWSFFFIAVAFFFHASSIIFVLVPFVSKYVPRLTKTLHVVAFMMIPAAILFSSEAILFSAQFVESERYAAYAKSESEGGVTFVVLMEMLSLICYLGFKKDLLNTNDLYRKVYVMAPFITLFAPFILRDGVFIRLSKYFHVYLTTMVPIAFDHMFIRKENKDFLYLIAIAILVLYTLWGADSYYFIWQEPYKHYIGH